MGLEHGESVKLLESQLATCGVIRGEVWAEDRNGTVFSVLILLRSPEVE